jgi:2-amino-4-hydroxy-6-hydroxymethyldihydropteridine diphosphokinase
VTQAYLSLGSNLGDRYDNLAQALRLLPGSGLTIRRVSSVYETEPQEMTAQPWFLNLIAEVETTLSPRELLRRCLEAEQAMGRSRDVPKGPRTIDIDLVLYGNLVLDNPGLVIPHPRMVQRRFVLEPLAELAPDFKHPTLGRTIRELLPATLDQKVEPSDRP